MNTDIPKQHKLKNYEDDRELKYSEALVEWQSSGFDDIPNKNLVEFHKQLQDEFCRRGLWIKSNTEIKNTLTLVRGFANPDRIHRECNVILEHDRTDTITVTIPPFYNFDNENMIPMDDGTEMPSWLWDCHSIRNFVHECRGIELKDTDNMSARIPTDKLGEQP